MRARLDCAELLRKGGKTCPERQKNIPEVWKSLPDDAKKIRKYSPEEEKNVHSDGKFIPENEDFSAGKSREKYENDENRKKNFFPYTGKNMKIILMARKNMSETG